MHKKEQCLNTNKYIQLQRSLCVCAIFVSTYITQFPKTHGKMSEIFTSAGDVWIAVSARWSEGDKAW